MENKSFIKHDQTKPRLDLVTRLFAGYVLNDIFLIDLDEKNNIVIDNIKAYLTCYDLGGHNFRSVLMFMINNHPLNENTDKTPLLRVTTVLREIGVVLKYGADKYEAWNWTLNTDIERTKAATMRHLLSIIEGEAIDEEWNLYHMSHAICNMMFHQYYVSENY